MSVRTTVKSIQDIMRQDSGVDGDAQRISQLCWMFFLKIIDDQDQELKLMNPSYCSPIPAPLQWRAWAADPEGITGDGLLTFVNAELFPDLKTLPVTGLPGDRTRVVRSVFEDAYNYMKSGQLMRQVVNRISGVDFNDLKERRHFGELYEQILNDLQSAGNAGEYYTPRAVTAFMVDRIDPKPGETLFDPACGTGGFLTCAIRHMRDRYVKTPEDEALMQGSLRAVEKKPLPHMLCVTNMLLHGIEDPGFVRHDNTLARPYISWTRAERVDIVLTNPPFGGREEDGIESNFPTHFRTRETWFWEHRVPPGQKAYSMTKPIRQDHLADCAAWWGGPGREGRTETDQAWRVDLQAIISDARQRAKLHWDLGEQESRREAAVRESITVKVADMKSLEEVPRSRTEDRSLASLHKVIMSLREEAAKAGSAGREARARGDAIYNSAFNLDFKNPNTIADDHGDPEEWLAKLLEAERETAALREELRTILAEALTR